MSASWPFGDLAMFGYRVILADPPWAFENYSEAGEGRNANQHYSTMTPAEIAALPVGHLARRDCALFLWVTDPLLDIRVLSVHDDVAEGADVGEVEVVADRPFKIHFDERSLRRSSRSTASRTKPVLSSPSVNTRLMRAKVPSANRACISSAHRFFRPTRGGVADMTFESQADRFRISDIASVSHMRYAAYLISVMEARRG